MPAGGGAAIGKPFRRKEDRRLLTGRGRFSDDVNLPGQVYAAMARSPHAHARILGIDASGALAVPGILAVLTGEDLLEDGLGRIPHRPAPTSPPDIELVNRDGSPRQEVLPFPLPADKVRFAGEAVAMVIGETADLAKDGLERLDIVYAPLQAVTEASGSCIADAPLLWEDMASNVCVDANVGDFGATERAFANARHVVRLETWIPRVTGVPMEPRAAVAAYDPESGRYTLHAGGGGVVRPKRELAEIFGVPEDRARVVAADVGGNYGTRNAFLSRVRPRGLGREARRPGRSSGRRIAAKPSSATIRAATSRSPRNSHSTGKGASSRCAVPTRAVSVRTPSPSCP